MEDRLVGPAGEGNRQEAQRYWRI